MDLSLAHRVSSLEFLGLVQWVDGIIVGLGSPIGETA